MVSEPGWGCEEIAEGRRGTTAVMGDINVGG